MAWYGYPLLRQMNAISLFNEGPHFRTNAAAFGLLNRPCDCRSWCRAFVDAADLSQVRILDSGSAESGSNLSGRLDVFHVAWYVPALPIGHHVPTTYRAGPLPSIEAD